MPSSIEQPSTSTHYTQSRKGKSIQEIQDAAAKGAKTAATFFKNLPASTPMKPKNVALDDSHSPLILTPEQAKKHKVKPQEVDDSSSSDDASKEARKEAEEDSDGGNRMEPDYSLSQPPTSEVATFWPIDESATQTPAQTPAKTPTRRGLFQEQSAGPSPKTSARSSTTIDKDMVKAVLDENLADTEKSADDKLRHALTILVSELDITHNTFFTMDNRETLEELLSHVVVKYYKELVIERERVTCFDQEVQIDEGVDKQMGSSFARLYGPAKTSGGGDCMFNGLSLALMGTEDHSNALRVLGMHHLLQNWDRYEGIIPNIPTGRSITHTAKDLITPDHWSCHSTAYIMSDALQVPLNIQSAMHGRKYDFLAGPQYIEKNLPVKLYHARWAKESKKCDHFSAAIPLHISTSLYMDYFAMAAEMVDQHHLNNMKWNIEPEHAVMRAVTGNYTTRMNLSRSCLDSLTGVPIAKPTAATIQMEGSQAGSKGGVGKKSGNGLPSKSSGKGGVPKMSEKKDDDDAKSTAGSQSSSTSDDTKKRGINYRKGKGKGTKAQQAMKTMHGKTLSDFPLVDSTSKEEYRHVDLIPILQNMSQEDVDDAEEKLVWGVSEHNKMHIVKFEEKNRGGYVEFEGHTLEAFDKVHNHKKRIWYSPEVTKEGEVLWTQVQKLPYSKIKSKQKPQKKKKKKGKKKATQATSEPSTSGTQTEYKDEDLLWCTGTRYYSLPKEQPKEEDMVQLYCVGRVSQCGCYAYKSYSLTEGQGSDKDVSLVFLIGERKEDCCDDNLKEAFERQRQRTLQK